MIRNNVDLVIVDSARAVARSLSIDENHADFGKLVIRKIAKLISDCGKSGIITHHNSKGSGKAAGTNDILAGVWGGFNLKPVEGEEELRTLQTDKKRETSILWQLRIQRTELIEGLPNGWNWSLDSDLSHMAPDQKWRDRFQNLLRLQEQPIGLRDAAQLMGLSSDEENTLRSSVGRDTACRRWLAQKPRQGVAGLYFMPHEFRNGLQQKPSDQAGVQTRETHPLNKGEEMLEVGKEDNPKGREDSPGVEKDNSGLVSEPPTTDPITIQPQTTEADHFQQNTPDLSGVSLSTQPITPVYVDGSNGWKSPSGRLPKAGNVTLIDPEGKTRCIDAKRCSLHPPVPEFEPLPW